MITLSPRAAEIERKEREAERERLIRRALAYAAEKREAEAERVRRIVIHFSTEAEKRFNMKGSTPCRRNRGETRGGGRSRLLMEAEGTGGGRHAQHTPKIEFSQK